MEKYIKQNNEEKYLALMIIGHGAYLTEYDNNVIDVIEMTTPIHILLGTFAAPTESCYFEADDLIELKDKLVEYSEEANNQGYKNMDNVFQHIVYQAQVDNKGKTYGDPNLQLSNKPNLTENWINGNTYFDKIYSDCPEFHDISCGLYVINNNIAIPSGTYIKFNNRITLSDILNHYYEKYGIHKIYILDCSCSVVYNPERTRYIEDSRILRKIMRNVSKKFSGGGGKKSKKRKYKNRKSKRRNKK
jgi:hypothetical protein